MGVGAQGFGFLVALGVLRLKYLPTSSWLVPPRDRHRRWLLSDRFSYYDLNPPKP